MLITLITYEIMLITLMKYFKESVLPVTENVCG